mgnify:CR=1 FL=1
MVVPFLSLSSKEEHLVVAQEMAVQVRQWEFFNPKMSFANIFGAPRTGVHAYRIFDVAVVDFGLTVLVTGIGAASACFLAPSFYEFR